MLQLGISAAEYAPRAASIGFLALHSSNLLKVLKQDYLQPTKTANMLFRMTSNIVKTTVDHPTALNTLSKSLSANLAPPAAPASPEDQGNPSARTHPVCPHQETSVALIKTRFSMELGTCRLLEMVTWKLSSGFTRHPREGNSDWAPYNAAENGHLAALKWLLTHYPKKNQRDAMGAAAENGHLEIVRWLNENRKRSSHGVGQCGGRAAAADSSATCGQHGLTTDGAGPANANTVGKTGIPSGKIKDSWGQGLSGDQKHYNKRTQNNNAHAPPPDIRP
ncbi:hypothetical protein ON010_g8837 [Phytophthora cinnamomi]|nr:hypothetical protein ON010_g8837 [Phytophthora cinnamomi]